MDLVRAVHVFHCFILAAAQLAASSTLPWACQQVVGVDAYRVGVGLSACAGALLRCP